MTEKLKVSLRPGETPPQAMARVALTPECLSAAVLVDSQVMGDVGITEVVDELCRQTAALKSGDLTPAMDMLLPELIRQWQP